MPFASLRVIVKFQTHSAAVLVSELDSGASISILHFAIPARASCAGMTPTAGKLAATATVSIASSRLRVPEGRSSVRIPVAPPGQYAAVTHRRNAAGTLAPRYRPPGSRCLVPEERLASFWQLYSLSRLQRSVYAAVGVPKVAKCALTRRGKYVERIIVDTRALERNRTLLGPIARSRKKETRLGVMRACVGRKGGSRLRSRASSCGASQAHGHRPVCPR